MTAQLTIDADEVAYLALSAGESATVDTPAGPVTVTISGGYVSAGIAVVLADELGARYVLHASEHRQAADYAIKEWLRKRRTDGTGDRALWLEIRRELRAGRSLVVRFREEPYYTRTRPVAVEHRPATETQ